MATISTINVSVANDNKGDTLRNAFIKVNDNFAELNSKKVEAELGKGLSQNNFSNADKTKLDSSLTSSDIANNLTTIVTGKALDATKGKELDDKITANTGSVFNKFFEVKDLIGGVATYSVQQSSINGGAVEPGGSELTGNIFSSLMYSAAAGGRGYKHTFNQGNYNNKNSQTSYFCFKKGSDTAGIISVMGNISGSSLPTLPNNGAWFQTVDNQLSFMIGNGTLTTSSPSYTITSGTSTSNHFYHCFFYRLNDVYYYRAYDNAFNQVMSGSLSLNIPLSSQPSNQVFQVYATNLPSPTNFFYLAKFGYGFGIPNQLKNIFNL